jgi:hypothetical protein
MYLYFLYIFCNAKCKEMIELWKRIEMEEDESQAGPSRVPGPPCFIGKSLNSRNCLQR